MNNSHVSTRSSGRRNSCGVGNLIIPKELDRAKYIERCYRIGTISIVLENGGLLDNVLITKSAIKDLEFPVDYKTLGSQVVWINKPKQNQPIVIGIISKSNEFTNLSQSKEKIRKSSSNGTYEVLVDSEKGVIIVSASSSIDSNGDIYIISTNKSKTSKLNVNVSGSIAITTPEFSINSSKKISLSIQDKSIDENIAIITYEKGIGFSYTDEFGNELLFNKDNLQFKPIGKFSVGNGTEPMVLGTTLKTAVTAEQVTLTTLINAIKNAPIVAGDGGASFKTSIVAALTSIQRGDYDSILSKISNTD